VRRHRASFKRELTEFLRARRASLRPADVGLPETRRGGSLTQEHVAELIGVSRQWYVQFEAGDVREPTLSLLRRTAEALRLGPEDVETLWRLASREALPAIARREPRVVGDATYRAALVRGPVAIIVAGDRYSTRLLDGEACGESVPLFLICGRLTRPRSVAPTTLGDARTPVALIGVMSADERSDRGFDVAVLEAARAIIAEMTTRRLTRSVLGDARNQRRHRGRAGAGRHVVVARGREIAVLVRRGA